jgi:hypothetical protein
MEVHELNDRELFTLSVSGHNTLYTKVKNTFNDKGELEHTIIRDIAVYWPEGCRGKNQPAQWIFNDLGEIKCNPYTEAIRLNCQATQNQY